MRTNLPITRREFEFGDGVTLMSTTDLRGRIAYANAAFVEVSGFGRGELVGQPHNVVRHVDMPPEAFADMWATLKGGESWTALVKNRRSDGDHYWVRANATPVRRAGRMVGYMSVRTRPARDEVAGAEALYRAVREGKARGRRFHKGLVVRTGAMAWASLPQRMPVRWRVRCAFAFAWGAVVAAAAALGSGGIGLAGFALASAATCGLAAAWMEAQIARPLESVLRQAQAVAAGQPAENVHLNRVDEIGLLMRAVNQAGLNLRSLVDDVGEQVAGLQAASAEIAKGSADLGSRTEQAASSLQQTAASMEQMTASVQHNAGNARQASAIAGQARDAAADGGRAVGRIVSTMQEITAASRRIAEIVGVIDGIAFQTNILALNASVEAARAGEQGRGFSVVAAEVRQLAQRSAGAAREIKALIDDSVARVEGGARLVDDAGRQVDGLVAQVQRVAALVDEISGSSSEQGSGIAQVNAAVAQLDRMTQQNAAMVEQSAAAAESMKGRSDRLAEAVAVFRSA
jgi:aerotaxis receptor